MSNKNILEKFDEHVQRVMNPNLTKEQQILNAALGLTGEAGEFADHIKKVHFQGHQLDKVKLKKEAGDILWYLQLAAFALETTIEEIMEINIEKLNNRYPKGFKTEDSINRKDHD